jgi:tetraacyldisaccharide 4'-kinase
MKAPGFWREDGMLARMLSPLGALYGMAGAVRARMVTPYRAPVPVICIGNLTLGGAGKTPTTIDILQRLARRGVEAHAVTRGYGGTEKGPHEVDLADDPASRVGDEPLLLAAHAPTWVARDRAAGIAQAVAEGAQVVVLDDGFQNPGFAKDLSIVVVDGGAGFGNGRVFPAGPLREPVARGLARADAVVMIGEGAAPGAEAVRHVAGRRAGAGFCGDRAAGEILRDGARPRRGGRGQRGFPGS